MAKEREITMTMEKYSFNIGEKENDGLGREITQWLRKKRDDQGGKECWQRAKSNG
jgi:hypothetical protein